MDDTARVLAAADRLRTAELTGVPCAPVRDLIGRDDVDAAYLVASLNVETKLRAGMVRVGRKIGLTSPAVQRQIGVETPDFGALLDSMRVQPGGTVPAGRLLQPRVEAEVAFLLGADLDGTLDSVDDVRPAVRAAMASIEIVDSRIADWDISYADTVADNASCGMFVVSDRAVPLTEVDPIDVVMSLTVDGRTASEGTGRACLGDPLLALLWLARTLRDLGDPLRSGEVVLSGALGPLVPVGSGADVEASISGLGSVRVRFA